MELGLNTQSFLGKSMYMVIILSILVVHSNVFHRFQFAI